MFSCKSSQKLHIYLLYILKNIYTGNTFENTVTGCLLTPLLEYIDKFPIAAELYEIYFICVRGIRKDATYGDLISDEKQMLLFQDTIKDRLTFLYNAAVLEDNLEPFLQIWHKLISNEGKITLPLWTEIVPGDILKNYISTIYNGYMLNMCFLLVFKQSYGFRIYI